MSAITFKRDTSFRKQFFVPDSFAHPAKMDAQLLIWIVDKYTKEGEVILDPMAGSGTMMLAGGGFLGKMIHAKLVIRRFGVNYKDDSHYYLTDKGQERLRQEMPK